VPGDSERKFAKACSTGADVLILDLEDAVAPSKKEDARARDGFAGRIAIHPDQVAMINACFSPSKADLAHARRVVEAFAADPDAGTIGIDGNMYDIPHLKAAHRTLAGVDS
jgi:citrate lyase subunit beta/citryl-CoA lyase